jgi:hypothetical protein
MENKEYIASMDSDVESQMLVYHIIHLCLLYEKKPSGSKLTESEYKLLSSWCQSCKEALEPLF